MSTVKCEICNREEESLFIVSHKERGRIRICESCLKQEAKNLLAQKELLLLLREDQSMACIPKEAVNRMTRLIGDADKAECKVNKLRSITNKTGREGDRS